MRLLLVVALLLIFAPPGTRRARARWRRTTRREVRRARRQATGHVPGVARWRAVRRRVRLARRRYKPCWLYRLPAALPNPRRRDGRYRAGTGRVGEHLYVGVAELGGLRKRWRQHQGFVNSKAHRRKVWAWRVLWWVPLPVLPGIRWWGVFPSVRLYRTRLQAEAAELKAIAEESPTYNVVGARPRRVATGAQRSAP